MCDSRLPKQFLLGSYLNTVHLMALRFVGVIRRLRKDLKHFDISESDWHVVAQDRDKWS